MAWRKGRKFASTAVPALSGSNRRYYAVTVADRLPIAEMPDQLRAKCTMSRFAIQGCGIVVLISAALAANSAFAIPTVIIGGIQLPAAGAGATLTTVAPPPAAAAPARPDFAPSGSVSWIRIGEAEFKPPLRGPGPVAEDPAHPTISNDDYRRTGAQPTFPVADLSNPILLPWAREQLRKRNADVLAGKPGFGPQQSCWPRGVPGFLLYGVQPVFIVQGTKDVLMIWQGDHQIRRIYLDVPHAGSAKPSWYGDSVGHYEGDSLVVDTVGLNGKTYIDGFLTPHTEKLHVVERFHLIDSGRTLEVNVHVEDPGAFTTPWDAIQRYRRVEPAKAENALVVPNDGTTSAGLAGPMLESSCAENNNSYFGNDALPIPQATTPDF